MKKIMVIIDGMEDETYAELGGLTPFEYANCKHITSFAKVEKIQNTPVGMEAESTNCILSLLGVKREQLPKGRAFLEAVANGIDVRETDLVLRANTVLVENGTLVSPCYAAKTPLDYPLKLHHVGGYRNILVIPDGAKYFETLQTFPPHENIGANINDIVCGGNPLGALLKGYTLALLEQQKNVTILPWSPSKQCQLPTFAQIHNQKAAMVCHADVVRGIALLMGMDCPIIQGATGDIDTNLQEKIDATLELIQSNDFVCIHINGTDEISHRQNPLAKAEFIKKIDEQIIGVLLKKLNKKVPRCEIMVTSDHATIAKTGKHSNMEVTCWKTENYFIS